MDKKKQWVVGITVVFAFFVLTACGSQGDEAGAESNGNVEEKEVGVAPGPYGEMTTEVISPLLEEKGYQLTVQEFNDYVQPNNALDGGQIDANLFQHSAYFEQFIADNDLDLVKLQEVPTLGMGIYSEEINDLDDLSQGATVSVANDAVNLARTLQVMEDNDLITIDGEVDETQASIDDIDENPKNLEFKTLDAAQLSRSLNNVDTALIPGNFSWSADLDPDEALALEDLKEEYKNIIAIPASEENSDFAQALDEVLESQDFKDAIEDSKFKDFEKPAFWEE
ncbi:amino acid ABC transporter substrate-binding protein [Tetragenococcus halophilus]|uniref:Amino acid ABC transporter substrate-binding protein n=1 Tax=Tetragenococcus halophilus TaxID=51669 RepID=A0A3G5FK31_TETHA|nr:MetQ/NlpA family ABC transporter substrate-binding protein [Tetragenococcus halophilus]AYW50713.1 amino acid ABC transporter substrate-binding protein [Tetragenococcus halophilus]GBD64966.1 hypothetical protein TEHD23766T_2393 [Tetragenococcus halophilus subsp. flandriensis]